MVDHSPKYGLHTQKMTWAARALLAGHYDCSRGLAIEQPVALQFENKIF